MITHKITLVAAAVLLGSVYPCAHAQDHLLGKYTGTYTRNTTKGEQRYGLELTIASVENGVVKGTAVRHGRQCPGAFPMEGTYQGNELVLKSGKGSGAEDCTANLRLVTDGNKLKGTMGTAATVELSK